MKTKAKAIARVPQSREDAVFAVGRIGELRRATELAPDDGEALFQLGVVRASQGDLRQAVELTRKALLALMAVIAVVSVWTPLGWRYVAERWFTLPNFFWFVPVPILVLALSLWIWRLSARPASHARPFILTLGLIFLGFSGLGISVWPNIIPPHISLWDAAAPPSSQVFMLPGALLIIPVILMYTAWSYYVFRGKVSGSEGYH